MEIVLIAYAVFVASPCGIFAANAAKLKGYDALAWCLAGLAFGVVALLGINAYPIRSRERRS